MKKIYLMTAMAIAMMFTACSSSEDGVEVDNPKTNQWLVRAALAF